MWVGDQFWHCWYLKTEHNDKVAQKSPFLQSLLFFFKKTNTDNPRNNNTQAKECCLSAHGVILCHSVRVMFRPAWLVSVRRMWGADEISNTQTLVHTHTQFNIQGTHRWCKGFFLLLQFLVDIIFSSWLQILAWRRKGGRNLEKEWDSEEEDKKGDVWY